MEVEPVSLVGFGEGKARVALVIRTDFLDGLSGSDDAPVEDSPLLDSCDQRGLHVRRRRVNSPGVRLPRELCGRRSL